MIESRPVRSVCVAGGGVVGWSAAASLKRRLPMLDVSIVDCEPPTNALADRMCGALPSINGFHEDLGLTTSDTIDRIGSQIRIGTEFRGWNGGQSYVHAYAPVGAPVNGCSFHLVWLRASAVGPVAPFDHFSLAAQQGSRETPDTQAREVDQGLTICPPRYRAMMRAFAEHMGVRALPGDIEDIRLSDDGFVEQLHLTDGRHAAADLFVDCTGPAARIRSAIDDAFIDWSRWLLCDRAVIHNDPPSNAALIDENRALHNGWSFDASSRLQRTHGRVYSSGYTADGIQSEVAEKDSASVAIRQGRRPEPWRKNVVAVGDSAIAIEPLEWSNLHLAHSAIDRIVSMMPGADFAPVELAEYNRQCGAEADRVRDFVCLHYIAGPTSRSEFWRDAGAVEPPPSLAHTMALFRERGRLPFYEEETFARDSWLTLLLCQGVRPRRVDPLADLVPDAEIRRAVQPGKRSASPTSSETPGRFKSNRLESQIAR